MWKIWSTGNSLQDFSFRGTIEKEIGPIVFDVDQDICLQVSGSLPLYKQSYNKERAGDSECAPSKEEISFFKSVLEYSIIF